MRKLLTATASVVLLTTLLAFDHATVAKVGNGWEVLALKGIPIGQVAIDRQSTNILHAIVGNDTHLQSDDRGQTWRTVASDLRPFYARDPNQPLTYLRWAPASPAGIERSQDNGQSWSLVWPGGGSGPIAAPPPGPGVLSVVLAGSYIGTVGYQPTFALIRSLDGGGTWGDIQFPGRNRKMVSAAFDVSGGVSFMAFGRDYVKCGSDLCTVAPTLWRSMDYFGGDFTQLTLPNSVTDILATAFGNGQLLLVTREAPRAFTPNVYGEWQSPDHGQTWFPVVQGVDLTTTYPTSLAIWPGPPTRILLGTTNGIYVHDLPTIQHAYLPLVNNRVTAGW